MGPGGLDERAGAEALTASVDALYGGGASAVAVRVAAREGIEMAKRVTELDDTGKPISYKQTRVLRRSSVDESKTVKTTSLRNLLDSFGTFRAGR